MRCQKCGNNQLQECHLFCFQCGESLSKANSLLETSTQQTSPLLKSSAVGLDGHGRDSFVHDKHDDCKGPLHQSSCPVEQNGHFTDHGDGHSSRCQVPASDHAEKQESSVKGVLPLKTPQIQETTDIKEEQRRDNNPEEIQTRPSEPPFGNPEGNKTSATGQFANSPQDGISGVDVLTDVHQPAIRQRPDETEAVNPILENSLRIVEGGENYGDGSVEEGRGTTGSHVNPQAIDNKGIPHPTSGSPSNAPQINVEETGGDIGTEEACLELQNDHDGQSNVSFEGKRNLLTTCVSADKQGVVQPESGKSTLEARKLTVISDGTTAASDDGTLRTQTGLSSDEKTVTVVFHALLTPTFNINPHQGDCRVVLRGQPPFSWKEEKQVAMRFVREVSNGFYVLEGQSKLTLREAQRKIAYKYYVIRSHAKNLWEGLVGFKPNNPGKHVNRCLIIPPKDIKDAATWHQYDDAIYSEPGVFDSLRNHIPFLRTFNLDPADGRRMAMMTMLPDWDKISDIDGGINAHVVLSEINNVVYCMSKTEFENGGGFFPRVPNGFDHCKVLYEYLSPRLNLNIQNLQAQDEDGNAQIKRLITSTVIASLLVAHKMMTYLLTPEMKDLLECLRVTYNDPRRQSCSEYDAIMRNFPKKEHRRILANRLLQLCTSVIDCCPDNLNWLFAVPLLHFLLELAEPFSFADQRFKPSSLRDNSWWGAEDMVFQRLRDRAALSNTKTPARLLRQLDPMFQVDPLFKRTFLLSLPIRDISEILEGNSFPLYEVCWTLTRIVQERDTPYLSDEEWESLERCIEKMSNDLDEKSRLNESQLEETLSVAEAVSTLLTNLLQEHGLGIYTRSLILSSIFQLLDKSLLFAKGFLKHSRETQSQVGRFNKIFHGAFHTLRDSLEKHFNGNITELEEWRREEFEVWSTLLSARIEDEDCQPLWENGVRETLKKRIDRIDQAQVMELYCKLDLHKYHPEIEDYFMCAAFEAVDRLVEIGISEEHMESLKTKLESSGTDCWQASGVNKLFALLLKRCWPKGSGDKGPSKEETLEHILSWKPMAKYFEYFGNRGKQRASLPEDGLDLLMSATSLLEHVGVAIKNAEIDVNTLRSIEERSSLFLTLFSIISGEGFHLTGEAGACQTSEDNLNQTETDSMKVFVEMRVDELKEFQKERDAVRCFVQMCSLVQSVKVDLDDIKGKMEKDISSSHMSELCHKRNPSENPIVKFFELSVKSKRMVQTLNHVQESLLFRSIWQKCLQKAADLCKGDSGPEILTLNKVHELVWTPCYQRWFNLWETIISGDISLKDVNERFGRFKTDLRSLDIETQIALAHFSYDEDAEVILNRRVDQIKQSFKLSECNEASETILEFKEAMGLEGDFQVLEDFCDQMDKTFQRRNLGSIDDDLLNMGRALEKVKQSEINCLKRVIDCKEYIFWLREELKGGREDVKTLVDLAMMSAGESDIETDRVSCLHTTALGFAPFIFDLNNEIDFNQLMNLCESVWKEMDGNSTLPKKLKDISKHLDWLKGVRNAHAMSSLKFAEAINERGVYCIGQHDAITKTEPCDRKTIHSVVQLRLPSPEDEGEDDEASSKMYSLESLQELQSKLALISGKQRSAGQDDVDKFDQILQGVVQLGQAYVKLSDIGDVHYLNWKKEYKCKSRLGIDVTNDITAQTEEFERHYQACKEHVNVQRMKHRELNYFTTQQLLFLRKELASIKSGAPLNVLSVQVYALLEKICTDIHPSTLHAALYDTGYVAQNEDNNDGSVSEQFPPLGIDIEVDNEQTADQQLEIVQTYERLLKYAESLSPDAERLAIAAIVYGYQNNVWGDADLVVWCALNKANMDVIDELYSEAKSNPPFRSILHEAVESESSQCSEDSDGDNISSSGDSDTEEVDSCIFEDIVLDETNEGIYLSLEEIAIFLSHLANQGQTTARRQFPVYLERGRPNLILAHKANIFPAVLSLYMDDRAQSLPVGNEVLVCTSKTTSEEVELLWRRTLADAGERLYCLVNADLLDYDVSQKAVDCLHTLMQDYPCNETFGLVILCSRENEERAHIVAALEEYRVTGMARYPKPEEIRRYLEIQFTAPQERPGSYCNQDMIWSPASDVNRPGNFNVRVVTSTDPGVGKSLVVQRLVEYVANLPNNLLITERMTEQNQEPRPLCVTIPLHDRLAGVADIVGFFLPHAIHSNVPLSRIFHLDSSCTVIPDLDTLMFNLLVLGELTDNHGRVWKRNPYDLYILEITYQASPQNNENSSCRFFELLPTITCLRPLKIIGRKVKGESPLFDDKEFKSEAVQRVWQYLRRFNRDPDEIQEFEFDPQKTEGTPLECLKTLIRNCGVRDPLWAELRQFVNFLNHQLLDCEQSVFCQPVFTEDTLEGFRIFVVRFMIIMSKDFSLRSLEESDQRDTEQTNGESGIRPLQLRRSWEQSTHPYLFFNPDHVTLTFLGFQVDANGNAEFLNPQTGAVVRQNLMSRHLRTGLHVQRVDLNNNFESYEKPQKIATLCNVMGLEWGMIDPDESYELTGDNAKKILAIHMRFRCNIPVIIMGETGCGKTRLIRYMCGLQTGGLRCKNLLLMKIHGGTTSKDIERNVLHAEKMAVGNAQLGIDTVLFFDEANTTEALGMIKEIMIDRRCNGRRLSLESNRLKFIVACNPYRKHTDEMIKKLESAGLGYHVKADEATERIGEIPLRQLVYRVHALPQSMRSLVWDFGRIQPEVEEKYIHQIVRRYVLQEQRFQGNEELVNTIARILAVSQHFMEKREDECSFVSLRDVKRAMEVMVWFYDHYKYFSPLLQSDEEESEEGSDSEEEEGDEEGNLAFYSLGQNVKLEDEISVPKAKRSGSCTSFPDEEVLCKDEMSVPQEKYSDSRIPFYDEELPLVDETSVPEGRHSNFNFSFPEKVDSSTFTEETLGDDLDQITWSLILALGVCYQARLQKRDEYRNEVAKAFGNPCRLPGGPDRIETEITRCQQAVMKGLKLGPNIACNRALSENVFMMLVCIELRIPLFVVGKPGSSKSLAKTVVADNMQGERSSSELFKNFKEIQLISYQCSPQSTSEGIVTTFQQCSELQDRKKAETISDNFASVVVLDEVGLAEDSPKMPLKTLHPLLEDSDKTNDDIIETEESFSRVAFIGLSNWALDPAKMNRGIMLSRGAPSEDELEETARGICGGDPNIMPWLEHLITPLVAAYRDIYQRQKMVARLKHAKKDEFFGLRDFYSLVKMISHIAKKQRRSPNWQELKHAIERNFDGLLEEKFVPVNIFKEYLGFPTKDFQDEEDHLGFDNLNLIREGLSCKSVMGEGRYLLILTENFAALPRIKQLVLKEDKEEPYVIFGSSFPKDLSFTQVCRNINRVKMCMETGRTVILLNLENLYESLYDALNQYYVSFGGEKYVDLGLGNHRVKCRVHKDFRLIVIAEKDVVYNRFPIPLINRMEKHFLVMSSGFTEGQKKVTEELKAWVEEFAHVFRPLHEGNSRTFTKGDAFIGYHEDCVPAVVSQVCDGLYEDGSELSDEERSLWEEKIVRCSKERLLQCATPDSVARLNSTRLRKEAAILWNKYFREQEHSSLADFLAKALKELQPQVTKDAALRAQISTHSRLLSDRDITSIAEAAGLPKGCVKCVALQQFQTEQQFCNCIRREFFAKLGGSESLLIVQCDSTDRTLDLVACARHLLIEECRETQKVLNQKFVGPNHILMIVQLDRVAGGCPNFVAVQGEGWLSVHIDELCPPSEEIPAIKALTGRSVSQIFESALNKRQDNFNVQQVLTSCVQEAASRIEDDDTTFERATRRVELLVSLLSPKTPVSTERVGGFDAVIAERVCKLLEERDRRAPNNGKEWIETEAFSATTKETGTFKKALWRRLLSMVAPILAELVAYVDRDGNLELAASENPWIVNLWLKVFRDNSVAYLEYDDFFVPKGDANVLRRKIPVLKSGYRSHSFQCKLPFSWLLKERIDGLYQDARSIAANSHESTTECMRKLLNSSEVQAILSEAISDGGEEVVACYLHDFAHMTYIPQGDDELKIVQRAIVATAREMHSERFTGESGEPFEFDLAVVHAAHFRIKQRLSWLSLLLHAKPDILPHLCSSFSGDENEMCVDACALQMCLESLEPKQENFSGPTPRREWCDEVLSLKVPVEAMIGKAFKDRPPVGPKTEAILTLCRNMWQRLSAVRMFIEHVFLSLADPDVGQTIVKFWKALGESTDFSKKKSLDVVERFLISCSEDSIQQHQKDNLEGHEEFLQRCNGFFVDIISVFCFGEDSQKLDPEVFEMLMQYAVGEEFEGTKPFSPFPRFGMDNNPVVRSFLLQHLINSSDQEAKRHLERFLYKAQGLSSEAPHVLEVCLLVVRCMENSVASYCAKNSNLDLHVSIGIVNKLCQDALETLEEDFSSSDELQVPSLDAIAKARYALDRTAEFMYRGVVGGDEKWSNVETRGALSSLFNTVQALCASDHSRSPALFLLKQLVKRYGVHSVAEVSQNKELSWIVPAGFQKLGGDGMTLDRFLVYGDYYHKLRDSLAGAILSENMDELVVSLQALDVIPQHAKDVIILLALYREVRVPLAEAEEQQQHIWQKASQMVKGVILRRGKCLSGNARRLAQSLLGNSPEKSFPFLTVSESQRDTGKVLSEILIHTTSVLECIEFDKLLKPLTAILRSPRKILDSFLPTMPEDSFDEARSAMKKEGGQWYECPAGHRYLIGNCGKPNQQRNCPNCPGFVTIGGENSKLAQANRLANTRVDRSNKGHILGVPRKSIAERDLSSATVSLLRIILHSAMLGSAGREPKVLRQLIAHEVQEDDVCSFLWEHLVNDVRSLSTSLDKSKDDVLLAVHLVLSEIVWRATSRSVEPDSDLLSFEEMPYWSTKEERRKWENDFVTAFARKVLMELDGRLQMFYAASVNDRRLGNDPLMREVYEVDAPSPPRTLADIHPGHATFWRYRTRITVELVIRNFQDVDSNKTSRKILGRFFDEEHKLRALQYLPDIVALQRILNDRFHRRIEREKADQLPIRDFLKDLNKDQRESVLKLFQSFQSAWDLVRHQLSSQGRFAPTEEQCMKTMDRSSSVSFLLPASKGSGVCCKGLMLFLVHAQNELVQAYHSCENTRQREVVPLSEVSPSQLIAYDPEKDLLPMMLASCSYSLEVGRETQLQYNWETLEKQIIDRFIRGRPQLNFDVDDFVFLEDARDELSFLKRKIPQKPISGHIRTQILSECKDLKDVTDVMKTLEIAVGFLSTSGGDQEMSIGDYCRGVLLLNEGKSRLKNKKAHQQCKLMNILDLWRTLALARARLLFNNSQDPFCDVPDCFKAEMPTRLMTQFSGALTRKAVDVHVFLTKVVEVISVRLAEEKKEYGDLR